MTPAAERREQEAQVWDHVQVFCARMTIEELRAHAAECAKFLRSQNDWEKIPERG